LRGKISQITELKNDGAGKLISKLYKVFLFGYSKLKTTGLLHGAEKPGFYEILCRVTRNIGRNPVSEFSGLLHGGRETGFLRDFVSSHEKYIAFLRKMRYYPAWAKQGIGHRA